MDIIKQIENELKGENELPVFKAGDNVTVYYKIKEGEKERIQPFKGDVVQLRGKLSDTKCTFTVRKVSNGISVERIFPYYSPFIDKIDIHKKGKVRRARLFYLRTAKGKAARIKEVRRKA